MVIRKKAVLVDKEGSLVIEKDDVWKVDEVTSKKIFLGVLGEV